MSNRYKFNIRHFQEKGMSEKPALRVTVTSLTSDTPQEKGMSDEPAL